CLDRLTMPRLHTPLSEPDGHVSKHPALQWSGSREVGSGHLAYLAPYCSDPPAPLRHVVGFPDRGLLRGLCRHGAGARQAIPSSPPDRRPSTIEAPRPSPSATALVAAPPGGSLGRSFGVTSDPGDLATDVVARGGL